MGRLWKLCGNLRGEMLSSKEICFTLAWCCLSDPTPGTLASTLLLKHLINIFSQYSLIDYFPLVLDQMQALHAVGKDTTPAPVTVFKLACTHKVLYLPHSICFFYTSHSLHLLLTVIHPHEDGNRGVGLLIHCYVPPTLVPGSSSAHWSLLRKDKLTQD